MIQEITKKYLNIDDVMIQLLFDMEIGTFSRWGETKRVLLHP